MNNKGQTLVFFVILIPLVFIIFAVVFDYSYMVREHNRVSDIGKSGLNYLLKDNKTKEEVEEVILKNDKTLKITFPKNNKISLEKNIDSIFGKIIGFDDYEIKVTLTGKIQNNKLIIEEEK